MQKWKINMLLNFWLWAREVEDGNNRSFFTIYKLVGEFKGVMLIMFCPSIGHFLRYTICELVLAVLISVLTWWNDTFFNSEKGIFYSSLKLEVTTMTYSLSQYSLPLWCLFTDLQRYGSTILTLFL